MRIGKILLLFFVCFLTSSVYAAEVNIDVDKTVISEGDTVRLDIVYNGESNEKPDLSSLHKDFQIVSQMQNNQFSFINGVMTHLKKWSLVLKPKTLGKITIKPIQIGNVSSNYIEIEVNELTNVAQIPDRESNSNSPYFQIEQSVYPADAYIQQQLIILVTIYDSIGLQNGHININDTSRQDWSVVPLSDAPIVKNETINGKKMNVVTFAFAAFPQKSGELKIPQFLFEGFYLKNSDIELADFDDFMNLGFNFQNVFGQQVPVRMRTKEQKISIKPIPNTFAGRHWLPLKKLTAESNITDSSTYKVGDAINRQLKLTAVGIQQNMLPKINFPETTAFKQYPELPETQESIDHGDIVTNATINTVYIPTKSGRQILPSLEIEWFNVETQQMEKTIIPEEEIIIGENAYISASSSSPSEKKKVDTNNIDVNLTKTIKSHTTPVISQNSIITLILFFIILALLLFIFFKKPKNPYRNTVILTVKKHDYKALRDALINWANVKFSRVDIKNLNMVADAVNQIDFSEQLFILNKLLYSKSEDIFDGRKFIEIFKKIDKIKSNLYKNNKTLPNLYD